MIRSLTDYFSDLIGIPGWHVQQGHGSFLTFEFGLPRQEIFSVRKRRVSQNYPASQRRLVTIHGDWHLWIYCCGWKILQEGKHLAHHESDRENIERACQVLNGQEINSINIDLETKHTQFCFDLGGFLETGPYDDELNEQWLIYCPYKNVFTFRSDGCYSLSRDDITPDKEKWIKITQTEPQHSLGCS